MPSFDFLKLADWEDRFEFQKTNCLKDVERKSKRVEFEVTAYCSSSVLGMRNDVKTLALGFFILLSTTDLWLFARYFRLPPMSVFVCKGIWQTLAIIFSSCLNFS